VRESTIGRADEGERRDQGSSGRERCQGRVWPGGIVRNRRDGGSFSIFELGGSEEEEEEERRRRV